MKIRKGFISNSSSSSFVVAFPHKPESVEDLKTMMFGKQKWHYADIYDDKDILTKLIAEKVLNKIKKEATKEEIYKSIKNGWFDAYCFPELFPGCDEGLGKTDHLNYRDNKEEIDKIWDKNEKINDKRAKNIAKAFKESNNEKFIVVMKFSDNDGESIEEHSDIFNRVKHIKTSYH